MDIHPPVDIGTDFLGYRIEESIGRGGMGVVYRAYDLRLKRPVALKLVAPSLALEERFRERFARETELVMSLEHPNVIPIYDAGDLDGRFYLAMRLVDGTDLASLLRDKGALEPAPTVAICAQIASALDAAHARGLVHRDVKPSNVLLDSSEHVYLADFGLTRRLDDQPGDPTEDRSIGTPAYLAPEQLDRQSVDGRADVYSLGCLLYECLTGERVFPRGSRLAEAWAHLEDEPPPASRTRPDLPRAVDDVISRALAKEPEQRYPTCQAFVSAAEEALGLRKAGRFGRRKPLLLAAAVLVAVGTAAALAAVLTGLGHGKAAAPLFAGPDTVARIDPTTNRVSAVIPVGAHPVVVAAAGNSVWVYNGRGASISEIDAATNRVVKTTSVSDITPAECCNLFAGPMLAADTSGAWFVNGGEVDKARLTHIVAGGGKKREYPLNLTPTGVAAGAGSVWVVGHRGHDYRLLRIDPATGRQTAATPFPARSRVDSIAFGFGAVWVMGSPPATLYRIDPRSARRTGSAVVTDARATRPEIVRYVHSIIVRTNQNGGTDFDIDPVTLLPSTQGPYGPAETEEYNGDLGALWWYDWPSGTVNRQQSNNGPIVTIGVTERVTGQPCLTSLTSGSGSLWVTAAAGPSQGGPCVR
jgi:DNA-binding beta-propeller fold protein YncE